MLREAWYAVARSEELAPGPIPVRVHGEEWVLFRGADGVASAIGARCPHRGAHLGDGCVAQGEIVCPFHGWRFNREGRCTRVPANRPEEAIPARARVPVRPVMERAGWVWLYTGETPRPLRLFPELEDPEYRRIHFELLWRAHFTRTVENSLDVSHLPFVHADTTGEVDPMVHHLRYGAEGDRLWIHPAPFRRSHPMEPPRPPREDPWSPEEQVEIELWFPNLWIIRAPVAAAAQMCTVLVFTPVDDQTTRIFGACLRNFAQEAALLDEHHLTHTLHVLDEDRRIVESLRPAHAPFDMREEAHVPSDGPAIRFRHLLRKALGRDAR
ncbi:aromatic ring-hydroxylating dioxygenase subunit alpha [Alicyclobacillus sp.]|uniref:aromatic ring-hydroxylating dioxygenase subunit alpha n=1 Tax=Alicyclobacillus sp. TaxID=61169 RepID=UPI0025C0CC09|nr:aromatic ring-hydroxylating dioxygenase subunit alpha [Alicyclobacillus sp.]MCL6516082.1 aromatic ring-hydroxylating dioxygenase subunit alpha [Alicyclobacillus sp.]